MLCATRDIELLCTRHFIVHEMPEYIMALVKQRTRNEEMCRTLWVCRDRILVFGAAGVGVAPIRTIMLTSLSGWTHLPGVAILRQQVRKMRVTGVPLFESHRFETTHAKEEREICDALMTCAELACVTCIPRHDK